MVTRILAATAGAAAAPAPAAPAQAVPPQHISFDPDVRIVEDTGQACGFPVRWTIDITSVEGTNYFDNPGTGRKDVGRVVWLPGTNEIVFSAGRHPIREANEFGTFGDALAGFCDVLA